MTNTRKYRYVSSIREEGAEFQAVLQRIADFYTRTMRGQVRRDGPDSLIKYSRDWEYPWVVIKAEIQPDDRVLDCGSGYSPLPFIWAMSGAEVSAIDRDIMICSRFTYALRCIPMIASDIFRLAGIALRRMKARGSISTGATVKTDDDLPPAKSGWLNTIKKAVAYFWSILYRIWKPDFWGPISPGLLRAYGVRYEKGDVTHLPYHDGEFDVVSCVSVLEHMADEDQIKGIREMSRVVKKGGKLIISYDKHEDLTDRFVEASGLTPTELVYFTRPDNLYVKNMPDVIGICLVK